MRRQAITSSGVVLCAVLALLVAGCGGGGSSTSSTTTTTSSAAAATTKKKAATTTSAKLPDLSILTSANCRQLLNISQSFAQAMEGSEQNLQKNAKLVQQFANKTPASIRPDFEVLAADWTKIATAMKGVNLSSLKAPNASVMARLVKLSSQLDTAKLTTASQHISAWAHANCG
ncbi:MAG TPA: hypothetical protein VG652_09360 [Gaiellaceae bacterium]|nr:hypothetical protein [Gaiellaceae bacterium]